MKRNDAIKTILFNFSIAILLIVFYHPNFVGLSIMSTSTLEATCAVTFLPILIVVFVVGNWKLIKSNSVDVPKDSKNRLINELSKYKTNEIFSNQILLSIQQLETFDTRKTIFKNVLNNNFKSDENYSSFSKLIDDAEISMVNNCKIILKSVSTFNYKEYNNLNNYKSMYSGEILEKMQNQHKEYLDEINYRMNQNANLLVELDNLIMEINRINDSDSKNELNGLVDMTAAMKQLHLGGNDEIDNLTHKYK